MKSGCAPKGEQPQTLHPPTLGVWGGRGGEGESVRIAEGEGQGESRHPDPTPRPDTPDPTPRPDTPTPRHAKGGGGDENRMRAECKGEEKP